MKIGIIKCTESVSNIDGVRVQGEMWKDGLVKLGHEVYLINLWENYDWNSFDCLIILQFGGIFRTAIKSFKSLCPRIAFAPIIDPEWGIQKFKFFTRYWGSQKYFGLTSRFRDLYDNRHYFNIWLVRSEFEAKYVRECIGIDDCKIKIVPLQYRIPSSNVMPNKELFSFHASRLKSENKNVERQIKAAIKYGYNFKLAGYLNDDNERKWLHNLINGHDNIEYVGALSDSELIDYYRRCKVFSLPSLTEGVGLVALEAAANGAEIVLTNDGGPKYYFKGRAEIVNPYDIDAIGKSTLKLLNNNVYQPELMEYVKSNFSPEACSKKLEDVLSHII